MDLGIIDNTYERRIADRVAEWPMRRMGTPADMVDAAAFLCSVRAGYTTRQVLVVGGGNIEALQ